MPTGEPVLAGDGTYSIGNTASRIAAKLSQKQLVVRLPGRHFARLSAKLSKFAIFTGPSEVMGVYVIFKFAKAASLHTVVSKASEQGGFSVIARHFLIIKTSFNDGG